MLWHYDCPMVMTVCWSSCFLPSPCPETWSQSLLAHFPISWRIPHYLVFKTFFPPKSPLFSPLHLPGMSLGTRACICLIYFALAQFLAVTKLVSSVTEAKQEVSSALWQLNGRIWERCRRELWKKASLLPVSWTLPWHSGNCLEMISVSFGIAHV